MLRIRLMRTGRKKSPSYRVVVAEAAWKRDGRRIAELGYYDPKTDPSTVRLDVNAIEDWIRKGAQPSDRVRKLLLIAKGASPPADVEQKATTTTIDVGSSSSSTADESPVDSAVQAGGSDETARAKESLVATETPEDDSSSQPEAAAEEPVSV